MTSDPLDLLGSLDLEAFLDLLLTFLDISHCLWTIEDLNYLFQRMAFRFGERPVSDCKDHNEEATEDYVELPSKILKAYRVGESSDDQGYVNRQEFAGESLASKAVREYLSLRVLVSMSIG